MSICDQSLISYAQTMSLLWISVPAVSKVTGVVGQGSIWSTEIVFSISIIVSTQTTQFVLIAVNHKNIKLSVLFVLILQNIQ